MRSLRLFVALVFVCMLSAATLTLAQETTADTPAAFVSNAMMMEETTAAPAKTVEQCGGLNFAPLMWCTSCRLPARWCCRRRS